MDILESFSNRLIDLMKDNGLNAESLGKAISVAPSVIRRWCLPHKDISIKSLIKLADYFKCSLDYLCGRSNKEELDYIPKECPSFMDWLPTVIKECNKSTYKIFNETKIKSSHFALWRKGSEPLLSSVGILAEFLGCSIDRLIGREQ